VVRGIYRKNKLNNFKMRIEHTAQNSKGK